MKSYGMTLIALIAATLLAVGCKEEQSSSSMPSSSSSSGSQSSSTGTSSGSSPSASSMPSSSMPGGGSQSSGAGATTESRSASIPGAGMPAENSFPSSDPAGSGQPGPSGTAGDWGSEPDSSPPGVYGEGSRSSASSDGAEPAGGEDRGGATSGEQGEPSDYPSGGVTPGMTTEESLGQLDGQLDASLAVFDGMILSERKAAQSIETPEGSTGGGGVPDEEAGSSVASVEGPLFEEADLSEPGGMGEDEATVPAMPEGGNGNNTIAGTPGTRHDRIPPDIPDGSDDDIVARQIREAAMNEADPELREKLWDEYRKYKGL